MLQYTDLFKNSFLQQYASSDIGTVRIIITLFYALILGSYVFFVYLGITKKTFFNKNFAISLVLLPIITAAIILAMQSNLVISLGMVGALSIIRYRTAIKEPMDLIFLFWSISIGIISGAGLYEIALVSSVVVTGAIVFFRWIPIAKAPLLLVVNADSIETKDVLMENLDKYCRSYKLKAQNIVNGRMDMVVEINTSKENELIKALVDSKLYKKVSILSHDGDVTF